MKTDKFIVVDENNRPMSFQGNQFCYVPRLHKRRGRPCEFAVQVYDKGEAQKLINQTIAFRKANKFSVGEYHLMPITINTSQTLKK